MDIIDEIKGLKNLMDQGAISEEEFSLLKRKIMSNDSGTPEYNNSSLQPSFKEVNAIRHKPVSGSLKAKATAPKTKSFEYETGNQTTVKIFKWGLVLCLLVGVVFWVRYDSIWALLISTVFSLASVLTVSRTIPRVQNRNRTLGIICLALILLVFIPIGDTSSDNTGSVQGISAENTDNEGTQARAFLINNTFANYGSGPTAFLRFTSSNGGWYGAMTMTMGSCDFVYSYSIDDKTIEVNYTGSNCDAAFEGRSMKFFLNYDNSITVYIQGQELKFNAI